MSPTGTVGDHLRVMPAILEGGGGDARVALGIEPPHSSVLLVEDDLVSRDVALLLLGRLGFRADVAENGIEALAAVHGAAYDLVLMDLRMPGMDGIEATRRIRAELSPEGQPTVIAMTAAVTAHDRALCLEAGMDDFLPKPVHLEELAAVLGDRGAPPLSVVPSFLGAEAPPVYDPALLDALVEGLGADGEEVRRDLIDTFLSESEGTLARLAASGHRTDGEALAFAAHALKAASATLGLIALAETARSVEERFRAGPELLDVRVEVAGLMGEYRQAIVALRAVLAAAPGPKETPAPVAPPGTERFRPGAG